MRILLIVTKAEVGGAQNIVRDLAVGLQEVGYEVTVGFGGEDDYLTNQLNQNQIDWHRFDNLTRSKNPIKGLQFTLELKRFLSAGKYDLVHLHSSNSLFGALASSWQASGTIFTFHGMSVLAGGYKTNWLMKFIYTLYFILFSRFVDAAVYLTDANRQTARNWYICPPVSKVIPNGIDYTDIDYRDKSAARQELGDRTGAKLSDRPLIGSIGRLTYAKNYALLIDCMQNLQVDFPNLAAVIIGDGPKEGSLRRRVQAASLEDNVFFAGKIRNAATLIPAFDVFALTSRYEGLPITLLETLQSGVPFVGPDVGGVADIACCPEVQLFAAGSQKELRERLQALLQGDQLRADLADQQREHATQFTIQHMVRAHTDLYTRLTSDS